MWKWIGMLAGVMALSVLNAPSAGAMPMLDIDQTGTSGGTITYDGAGGPLVGEDITFGQILGVDTPENDGEVLTGEMLFDFTTGDLLGNLGSTYVWSGPGSFTISGTVIDSGGDEIASGVLVSGTFTEANLLVGSNQMNFTGVGIDSKNEDLAGYFGLGPDDWSYGATSITTGALNIDADGNLLAGTVNVGEADFINTKTEVPEPATLGLLGVGLAGLGFAVRRRRLEALAA